MMAEALMSTAMNPESLCPHNFWVPLRGNEMFSAMLLILILTSAD